MKDVLPSGVSHLSVLVQIRQQCLDNLSLTGDSRSKTLLLRGGDSRGYHRLVWVSKERGGRL